MERPVNSENARTNWGGISLKEDRKTVLMKIETKSKGYIVGWRVWAGRGGGNAGTGKSGQVGPWSFEIGQ